MEHDYLAGYDLAANLNVGDPYPPSLPHSISNKKVFAVGYLHGMPRVIESQDGVITMIVRS